MPYDKVTLTFQCPGCGKIHQGVKPEMAGHKVRCQCGFVFRLGSKAGSGDSKSTKPPKAKSAKQTAGNSTSANRDPSKQPPSVKDGNSQKSGTQDLTPSKYNKNNKKTAGADLPQKPAPAPDEGLTLLEPDTPGKQGNETVAKSGTEPSFGRPDRLDSFPAAFSPLDKPEQFGKYEVLRQIGEGGMGVVYLCRDSELERLVALKVPKTFTERQTVDRFFREAKSAAVLNHPNICPVYEFGELDGQRYMTMAYIEGVPLSQLMKEGKKYSFREVAEIIKTVAETLDEAHDTGVIHRDLKPSNITINHRGQPIIMDFGLARRHTHEDTQLTISGSFLGTPAYVSPEQIKNRDGEVDGRTDIYSLGVMFYQMLTGKLPFEGKDAMAVLGIVLTEEPQPPSEIVADLPKQLEEICLRAMEKLTIRRYQSMAELANAIDSFLKSK